MPKLSYQPQSNTQVRITFDTKVLNKLFLALGIIFGVYGLVFFLIQGGSRIFYPYSLNLGEAPLAQSILLFAQGISPYRELNQAPFSLTPYGPVYILLTSIVNLILQMPFAGGRLLTLVSTLVVAIMIYRLLTLLGLRKVEAGLIGLLFLSLQYTRRWGIQVNVDMHGVMWELASVYAFVLYIKSGLSTRKWMMWGIGLATVAFYTKSSCILGGAAFGTYLLVHRQWKSLLQYSVFQLLPIFVIYIALNLLTSGQYFFHTTYEISQRLFFYQFIPIFWKKTWDYMPLITVAGIALMFYWRLYKQHKIYMMLYLILSVLITVSVGKQGSATNYFLQFCVGSCLAIGLLLIHLSERKNGIFLGIAYALIFIQLFTMNPLNAERFGFIGRFNEKKDFFDKLSKEILKTPDPIISWDMSLLLANDRQIYYEAFPMAQMSYSGVWDEKPIIDALDKQKVNLIITYFYAPMLKADRNFTPGFISMFRKRYRYMGRVAYPWDKKDGLYFYVPNRK